MKEAYYASESRPQGSKPHKYAVEAYATSPELTILEFDRQIKAKTECSSIPHIGMHIKAFWFNHISHSTKIIFFLFRLKKPSRVLGFWDMSYCCSLYEHTYETIVAEATIGLLKFKK